MRKHIKRFLGEDTYDALREFCKKRGLFFEDFCRAIYDGALYAYEEEDIISYLGGEDNPYGSNAELVKAIHNEYGNCFDSAYGTRDNIATAINRIVLWGDARYPGNVIKEAIAFLSKDDEPTE